MRSKLPIQMHTGQSIRADHIKAKKFQLPVIGDDNIQLALQSHLMIVRGLHGQISILEQITPAPEFHYLKTTPGIGDVLAETILLETGDINRFKGPGNYASYCRCVDSRRESNGTNSRRFRRKERRE